MDVASADSDAYDGYLSDVDIWDGVTVDASEESVVPIQVGAVDGYAFAPVAVYVETGTTIEWEWTGEGGGHNVVHDTTGDPLFDSTDDHSGNTTAAEGYVYEFTFESGDEGVYPYVCTPHRMQDMNGVVVVGEEHVETDTVPFAEYTVPESDDSFGPGFGVVGALGALGGVAYLLSRRGSDE